MTQLIDNIYQHHRKYSVACLPEGDMEDTDTTNGSYQHLKCGMAAPTKSVNVVNGPSEEGIVVLLQVVLNLIKRLLKTIL